METNNKNLETTEVITSPKEKAKLNEEMLEISKTIVPKENFCVFCGEDLEEGKTSLEHHQFKRMCVNCTHCEMVSNGYVCQNEENKNTVLTKMKEAASAITEAYKLVNIEISPLPLKKPKGKCKYWTLSEEVKQRMETLFV